MRAVAGTRLARAIRLAVLLLAQLAWELVPFLLRRAHNQSLVRSEVRLFSVRKT